MKAINIKITDEFHKELKIWAKKRPELTVASAVRSVLFQAVKKESQTNK